MSALDPTVAARLRAFSRRVQTALFAQGAAEALAVLAVVGALVLLGMRLFERWAQPQPAWLLGLVAAVAWGIWRAVRGALPRPSEAAHLDRRLGLDGLLISAVEIGGAGSWGAELRDRLAAAGAGLPRLRWKPLLARAVPPLVLLLGVTLLPAPVVSVPTQNPQVLQALVDVAEELELAVRDGVLPEERAAELRQRVEDLRNDASRGGDVTWSDVDGVADRLQQERGLQAAALQKAASAVGEFAAAARGGDGSADPGGNPLEARQQELLDKMMKSAAAAGLGSKVDPALLEGAKLGDAEAMQALAEAMAQAGLDALGQMGNAALAQLPQDQLADLQELLAGCCGGDGAALAPGAHPGRGGVNRGPGHAFLDMNNDTQGDTSALQAKKLPPGRAIPTEWEVMQVSRTAPEVAPQQNTGAGSTASGGAGQAAWQRRLAPRHRAVVRDFFTARRRVEKGGTGKGK